MRAIRRAGRSNWTANSSKFAVASRLRTSFGGSELMFRRGGWDTVSILIRSEAVGQY